MMCRRSGDLEGVGQVGLVGMLPPAPFREVPDDRDAGPGPLERYGRRTVGRGMRGSRGDLLPDFLRGVRRPGGSPGGHGSLLLRDGRRLLYGLPGLRMG